MGAALEKASWSGCEGTAHSPRGPRAQVWTFSPMKPRDMANNVLARLARMAVAVVRRPNSLDDSRTLKSKIKDMLERY